MPAITERIADSMTQSNSSIHPTAIVSPKAKIGAGVSIGPYAVIDENVSIGKGTKIGIHAVITGYTEIGENNQIGVGAVIGLEPQDIAYKNQRSFVKIGDRNNIREYVQIHRGTKEDSVTRIGNDNFLMGLCHIAHNCQIGNSTIIANSALLAGYAEIADFAFLSGNVLVHQFCRVGKSALMRGGSGISLDLPPYCVSDGDNGMRGINVVGLERRGFTSTQIRGIKRVYRDLFSADTTMDTRLEDLLSQDQPEEIKYFLEFIKASTRGIVRP